MPLTYWHSLAGGALIGVACAGYLLMDGRIAGMSGLLARTLSGRNIWPGTAFLLGLASGPLLWRLMTGTWPEMIIQGSWPLILVSGIFVGFGTRLGSGCTSGHGVIGLARLSPRSMVAVLCFLGTGMAAATLIHLLTGG
ncbi:YeeE/YedE family protein [Gluconobacter sp. AC10]|uniref:YeeE/YedE family protein n=1 Tax=Gluconobacter aidae TaxID=2662454 RepID=A0A7X1SR89_9PROT|nr:YeeE/YedE family protein [Gluconobacter aidae]